jgi:hypothetical protein
MISRLLGLVIVLLLSLSPIYAQYARGEEEEQLDDNDENSFFNKYVKNKFFTGGGLSVSLGNPTYILAMPVIGYRFDDKLRFGLGINYTYIGYRNFGSTTFYGGRCFVNYHIFDPVYLIAEYSVMNVELFNGTSFNQRVWVQGMLMGAGYRQSLSKFSFVNLEVLYNVIPSQLYPYSNPIIRGGVIIGL